MQHGTSGGLGAFERALTIRDSNRFESSCRSGGLSSPICTSHDSVIVSLSRFDTLVGPQNSIRQPPTRIHDVGRRGLAERSRAHGLLT
jgi:hypothetical protein